MRGNGDRTKEGAGDGAGDRAKRKAGDEALDIVQKTDQ